MNLLTIENLSKSYGERVLFEQVTFGIDESEKIGIIGVNGTGKTTFLKIIAGVETPDTGKITMANGIQVGYLPQNPEFDAGATVLEQVFRGNSPVMQVLRAYEQALVQVQHHPDSAEWQKTLISLSQQMDASGAWQLESDAKTILTKLGVHDFEANVRTLSGGQRKRVALASALINPVDILILDEPTNHIDNDTVAWLEQYLQKRKGALMMITHDRYFLDRVATRIIEIDQGRVYSYAGNYSKCLEMKVEREEQQEASQRKKQNLLRNELAWIRRGARARSTKQKARIDRFEQLSAEKTNVNEQKLEMAVGASRLGRTTIELQHISQDFDGRNFIQDFNYIVLKDDRMGIVGPNGSGKSTLLNIMAGQLVPDGGTVEIGQTVKIGYFSQENAEMNQDMRVIDYIKEEAGYITTADGDSISAGQMLERFLFPPYLQWIPIEKLSGGEKRRLYLLRVLMGAPNVLLLDEPTNDLDIQTLTILEDYLDNFQGAVIVVSHDRYFLDRVVDKIFAFEGHGHIKQYVGGYSDYRENIMLLEAVVRDEAKKSDAKAPGVSDQPKERALKFTFKEQREYEQIDDMIAAVEQELQAVNIEIDAAGSNFEQLQKLVQAQRELEDKLDELLERWTYLNELAEKISNTSK